MADVDGAPRQTCWRRPGRWTDAGVFDHLHRIMLPKLNTAGELDWCRACVNAFHVRAKKRAPRRAHRRKTGGKHHLICEGDGTPLKVITTAANVNDVTQTWLGRLRPARRRPCRPPEQARPGPARRQGLRQQTSTTANCAVAASCRSSHDATYRISGLGKLRYVVEQTFAMPTSSSASPSAGNDVSTSMTPGSLSPASHLPMQAQQSQLMMCYELRGVPHSGWVGRRPAAVSTIGASAPLGG